MNGLKVGQIVHGFAQGAFGRDSYDCRRIEAVGVDWILTRNRRGVVEVCTYRYLDPDDRSHCDDYCPYEKRQEW